MILWVTRSIRASLIDERDRIRGTRSVTILTEVGHPGEVLSKMLKVDEYGYIRDDGELLHRLIWEDSYGAVPYGWVVHHCDGNKLHNGLDNLVALPEAYHNDLHARLRLGGVWPSHGILMDEYRRLRSEFDRAYGQYRDAIKLLKDARAKLVSLGCTVYDRNRKDKHSMKRKDNKKAKKKWEKRHPRTKAIKKVLADAQRSRDLSRYREIKELRKVEEAQRKVILRKRAEQP